MCPIFISHSSVDEHLGSFYFLTIVNRVAVTTDEQVSLQNPLDSVGVVQLAHVAAPLPSL